MNIFLDDDRNLDDMTYMPFANIYFENEFSIVRNVEDFKKLLDSTKEKINWVSFDHDLEPNHYNNLYQIAGKKGTGGEALEYFLNWVKMNNIQYNIKLNFHTMNWYGLKYMLNLFHKYDLKNVDLYEMTPSGYLAR